MSGNSPLRILIVDDQVQNLEMLRRRLERRGYQVVCTTSATGVEDLIEPERIDLVLLDWMMPERSGLDVLIGLRQRFDKDHIPVIVVTALDEGAVVAAALAAGANDYVAKPVDLQVLLARLNAHLERRTATLQLEEVKRGLEQTVHARTRELVDVNASLSAEIAERKSAEARAQSLARHDALTGLANRRHFLEELGRRTASDAASFVVLYIDLDRFKPVNDVYGHAVGDQLLQVIAERLSGAVRGDCLAARLGGDEFAVLAPCALDQDVIRTIAQRIQNEICAPILLHALKLQVGASIGAARYPIDGRTAESLLQHADAAMMQAKSTRGGLMFFDAALDQQLKAKAILEAELRLAIANRQIAPFFQPVVALDSGALAGFEVLARWPHQTRGMISPGEFIPIAEEAGLIDPLFWSMLDNALQRALAMGGDFFLAVNTSPTQVRDQWFPQKIIRALQENNFPARRLVVEVTESSMISDMDRAQASLLSLKNQGVSIALDDFGTGFSSLSLLRELPLDKVKIDRSFVTPMLHDPSGAKIVEAILGLGGALQLDVVAEGIETPDVAAALRERGCAFGQGYLFGHASAEPRFGDAAHRAQA